MWLDGTFTMNGGSITKCTANAGGGGGVCVSGGTFIMNDGIITGNSAKPNHTSTDDIGCGGGVYGKDATITINGGTITGNKATNGGGLYTSSGNSPLMAPPSTAIPPPMPAAACSLACPTPFMTREAIGIV